MKLVLIFGGKSPVAIAIAKVFASNGFNVHLIARNCANLTREQEPFFSSVGSKLTVTELDVSDTNALRDFISGFKNNCPEVVISVLGRQLQSNHEWDDIDSLRALVEGNYLVPAAVLELFAGPMLQQRKGTLIGVSSVAGERGRQKNYPYGAAKAGFTAYLSGLRNRLAGSGVHVITVKPGVIKTDATASLSHPSVLVRSPDVVGQDIYRAYTTRKNTLYTPWFWAWIMLVIRLIPEAVFKRLNL